MEIYVQVSSAYFDTLAFLDPLVVTVRAEQKRYEGYHSDATYYYYDGSYATYYYEQSPFSAVWERLLGKIELPLIERENASTHLSAEFSWYRQKLDTEFGFTQDKDGKQVTMLITVSQD